VADYDNDITVGDLNQKFEQAKAARSVFEPGWMLNRAFFAGEQWVMWTGGTIRRVDIDKRRQPVTDNRITPVVTSRVARKTKTRPTFQATPQGADDSAIDATKVGEQVLENDWEALDLQPKTFEALLWADVCCDGFIKTFWDKTKGEKEMFLFVGDEPVRNPQDGTPLRASEIELLPEDLDPEVAQEIEARPIAQGDVCVEVMSVFEMFPDPLATSMEDLEWMIEEKVRSKEYVRRRYPTDIDGNPFEPQTDADVPSGITEGWGSTGQLYSGATALYQGVKVREYWCKPNSKHPNGWWAVWANDTLLAAEEPFDPMPYTKYASIEVPGRFWSQAVTSNLRGPQIELNTIRTQISENARRLGNPALLKSRQADVRYSGVPGEVIEYDSTVQDAIPSYLEPPSIPVYVENEIARIEKSIEEISGMHEVSRATVPAGVTAASAINLLQEADETRLGPEIHQMEKAMGTLGTKILKLRAKFNTDERLLMIAGEDSNWDILAFKGEMLGADPHVEVQAGSQMPQSKAAKQAAMTETLGLMLQYGVQIDERNLRKFLKEYQVGGLDRLFEGFTEDAKQVNRENRILSTEITPLPINNFDNHEFHIAEHTEYQKTSRYARLPDEVKMRFDEHVAAHRQYMVQMVDNQMAEEAKESDQQTQMEFKGIELEESLKSELEKQQAVLESDLTINEEAAKAAFNQEDRNGNSTA
jgi:hypothetical protein